MTQHDDLLTVPQRHGVPRDRRPTAFRIPSALAVTAAMALALSACSASDDSGPSSPTPAAPATGTGTPTATEMASGSSGTSTMASGTATTSSSAMSGQGAASLEDAAESALKNVPHGTVTSIETESDQNAWEIQIVTKDGTEHEVLVAMSDGSIMGSPSTKQEDAQDRKKHQDRVAAATLDFKQAARKMREAVPDARIAELNIDTEGGTTVWEADLVGNDGTKHEVTIDAASGSVIKKKP